MSTAEKRKEIEGLLPQLNDEEFEEVYKVVKRRKLTPEEERRGIALRDVKVPGWHFATLNVDKHPENFNDVEKLFFGDLEMERGYETSWDHNKTKLRVYYRPFETTSGWTVIDEDLLHTFVAFYLHEDKYYDFDNRSLLKFPDPKALFDHYMKQEDKEESSYEMEFEGDTYEVNVCDGKDAYIHTLLPYRA